MRKLPKKQLDELLEILEQAHSSIEKLIYSENRQEAAMVLEECQNVAITIGQAIEDSEGENTNTVRNLEEYCEELFSIHEEILSQEDVATSKVRRRLDECYKKVKSSYENEVIPQKLAVFLPYKASMWDSLESVWREYNDDPQWEAVVVPIPYFDKNPDGSFREYHYEGDQYPDDVPVVYYKNYDLDQMHPDEIYIHNPYDDNNYVTSVHPAYYSFELKNYTDKLIYIPYFVLAEPDPSDKNSVEGIAHFAKTTAAINAHEIRVQSENMRLCYIEALVGAAGEDTREIWERKIKATPSPKFNKLANTRKENLDIPEEWIKKIRKADGTDKKVILYNTSVRALLQESELMLDKIKDVLLFFKEKKDDVTLLWRPHPLMKATISSMRPDLWKEYNDIVEKYIRDDYGIYDDSADLDRAIVLSDAYYGDTSSVVQLCQSVKKPIMIQNVNIRQSED